MKIQRFNENWRTNPDNNPDSEWTVGKLIKELQKYDSDQPVRIAHDGYTNREIHHVEEGDEGYWDDNEQRVDYRIVNIFGE